MKKLRSAKEAKDEVAKNKFLEAYEIVKNISLEETQNADVYLEAAHALGRYGQKIGIMSAITEGIADRVKIYLNKALKLKQAEIKHQIEEIIPKIKNKYLIHN